MNIIEKSKVKALSFYDSQWFNYIICMVTTLFMSLGEGSFLFHIVPYLDSRGSGALDIGITNGILSGIEAFICLLTGFLYKNRKTKLYMSVGILCVQAGAIILIFQPLGWMVKFAAGLNGLGIGILLVLVQSTLLANRPKKISLGLTMGLYTSAIAAGNGIGAFVSGIIIDSFGFSFGFFFCLLSFIMLLVMTLIIRSDRSRHNEQVTLETVSKKIKQSINKRSTAHWLWKTSLVAGFSMACIIVISEVIFPIFALRNGMSISFLGSLLGIKMIVAAIIRPLTGFILIYIGSASLTAISLIVLTISVISLPFVGLSNGLIICSILIGLAFGIGRVTSATLSVENVATNAENGRRIGLYTFALSFGQIISPIMGGWIADNISLEHALVGLPLIFLAIYGLGLIYLWWKNSNSPVKLRNCES